MASWTAAEEQFLIEHYPIQGKLYCADKLNRSHHQIRAKAHRMGLKRAEKIFRKTHEQYETELFEREIDYFPIDRYIDSATPILHECLQGHIWPVTPNRILTGHGCPHCYGNIKKTTEEYSLQLPTNYILMEEYNGTDTLVAHKHITCGHEWLVRPHDILQGSRCPVCSTGCVNPKLPAILYFVSFTYENSTYYKIGITGKEEVHLRFRGDWNRFNMEVIWQVNLPYGKMAKVLEKNLLKDFNHLKINTGLLISGNTETISEEIECPV